MEITVLHSASPSLLEKNTDGADSIDVRQQTFGAGLPPAPIFTIDSFFVLAPPSAFGVVQKKDTSLMHIASKPVSNYGGEGGI